MTGIPTPPWASNLVKIGKAMASIPSADFDKPSARLFLSAPTGQYLVWMIASGSLMAEPKLGVAPEIGDRVLLMLGGSVCESVVEARPGGGWQVKNGVAMKQGVAGTRPPGIVLPVDAPKDDAEFRPKGQFLETLKLARPQQTREWYAAQSASPIVVVGKGREYLNNQRRELLDKAPNWFEKEPAALLNLEHGGMTNAERMLRFPYMILAPDAADHSPWISELAPRIVIYTRWSYYLRAMKYQLFSRSPAIIIGNRRVESNYDGVDFLSSAPIDAAAFGGIRIPKPVSSMFAKVFTAEASRWDEHDEDDL